MSRFKLNRWVYMAVVIIIAVCGSFVTELGSPLARITFALLLPLLTFPMGAIGTLCALVVDLQRKLTHFAA